MPFIHNHIAMIWDIKPIDFIPDVVRLWQRKTEKEQVETKYTTSAPFFKPTRG